MIKFKEEYIYIYVSKILYNKIATVVQNKQKLIIRAIKIILILNTNNKYIKIYL